MPTDIGEARKTASRESRRRCPLLHPIPLPMSTAVFCFDWITDNLAQEVLRGMREAASRGFWVASRTPYGYNRVMVQDGPKKRPTLEPDPTTTPILKRIFDMAEAGRGMTDITRTLNDEGIASPAGKLWGKTSVHAVLKNEVYTGALVWGAKAKDNAEPVRVDKAFPGIISKAQFRRVNKLMRSRAPKVSHPRRVGSSYLLSGLVKCKTCNRALSGQDSKSGQFSYYVCQSIMKRGSGACDSPRLNARRFEELVVGKIRSNILTESSIRALVKVVDEEMDGVASEQRKRLETIDSELADVRRRLDRLYNLVETTELDMADVTPRIRDHRERQGRLESSAQEARAILSQRREVLDDVQTITAYAQDMSEFLNESELTERRAFIESFVKEIVVMPGNALMRYTVPMPDDSSIPGGVAEKVALNGSVLSTVQNGGPDWTKSRTEADSVVTPSDGMGMVYVSTASSPVTSIPFTKLRMRALRSGKVPSCKNSRKSATYPLISSVPGRSTLRCSNRLAASSRAAVSWSWRCRRDRMRGDRASMVNCFVSNAS